MAAPVSVSVSKDTQNVPAVSRDNEIRMQRFAAISVIPDYEILGIRARRKATNTLKLQREYTIKKNEIISKKLKEGFVLPSFNDLVKSFLAANPPPPHYDIQGKRLDNDDNEPNSEVSQWMKMRNDAIEVALFEAMGVEKPALGEAIEENGKGGEGEEEPAVMFLDFADREDEMEAKIQKIVDTDVSMKHYDIACVSMYEWLCLETLSQTPVKYRDPQLNNLHKARLAHSEEASSLIEAGAAKVIELGLGLK